MSSKSSHLPGTPKRHDQFSQQQHDTTITHASVNAAASPNPKSTGNEDSNGGNNDAGNTSSDDYSDEIKVYNEEGAAEEEQRNSDDLKEEKTEIIQKTIEVSVSRSFNNINIECLNCTKPGTIWINNPLLLWSNK